MSLGSIVSQDAEPSEKIARASIFPFTPIRASMPCPLMNSISFSIAGPFKKSCFNGRFYAADPFHPPDPLYTRLEGCSLAGWSVGANEDIILVFMCQYQKDIKRGIEKEGVWGDGIFLE